MIVHRVIPKLEDFYDHSTYKKIKISFYKLIFWQRSALGL